jgi:hypothetical protein
MLNKIIEFNKNKLIVGLLLYPLLDMGLSIYPITYRCGSDITDNQVQIITSAPSLVQLILND